MDYAPDLYCVVGENSERDGYYPCSHGLYGLEKNTD